MKTSEINKDIKEIYSKYQDSHNSFVDTWQDIILFTTRWWLGLALSILPWLLWWKLHNKRYTGDLWTDPLK